jgi:hypothetical protein
MAFGVWSQKRDLKGGRGSPAPRKEMRENKSATVSRA